MASAGASAQRQHHHESRFPRGAPHGAVTPLRPRVSETSGPLPRSLLCPYAVVRRVPPPPRTWPSSVPFRQYGASSRLGSSRRSSAHVAAVSGAVAAASSCCRGAVNIHVNSLKLFSSFTSRQKATLRENGLGGGGVCVGEGGGGGREGGGGRGGEGREGMGRRGRGDGEKERRRRRKGRGGIH